MGDRAGEWIERPVQIEASRMRAIESPASKLFVERRHFTPANRLFCHLRAMDGWMDGWMVYGKLTRGERPPSAATHNC